jgi:hypothetical protein
MQNPILMKDQLIPHWGTVVAALLMTTAWSTPTETQAQVLIADWNSYNSATTTFPLAASSLNSSMAGANLAYNNLFTINDSRGVWSSSNQSATLDVLTAPYLQWTFNIKPGQEIDGATFFLNLAKLDSSTKLQLSYSLDDYASSLGDLSSVSSSYQNYMFSVGNLSGTVSFRLYAYDVSALYASNLNYANIYNAMDSSSYPTYGGTYNSLMNGASAGLLGTPVIAPVPEPSTFGLAGLGMATLAVLRRRV